MGVEWMRDGNCHPSRAGLDRDERNRVFFPDVPESTAVLGAQSRLLYAEARAYCSTCSVVVSCYEFAQERNITDGFMGGMSPRQRAKHRAVWRSGEAV